MASSSAAPGAAAGFPVRTQLFSREINGVATDFSFSAYMDQALLIVTQLGTCGTLLACSADASAAALQGSGAAPGAGPAAAGRGREEGGEGPSFTVSVLLGKRDEPLLTQCARSIVQGAHARGYERPLVVGLAFKEHSVETVRQAARIVVDEVEWTASG